MTRGPSSISGWGRRVEVDRRTFLRGSALALGAFTVVTTTGCIPSSSRGAISTFGKIDFVNQLNIPPLAASTVRDNQRVFDLTVQSGRSSIVSQGDTDTWGVNGPLLGPTLRAKRGEQVRMHVSNQLDEATTLHWHGMRVPASADGGPHQMIEPGAVWSPSWTIDQPAATLWYHPHPHGQTERHVHRGIGGFFLLDDDNESQLPLPREYGVDDLPLIVQDRTFDEHGALVETERRDNGMLGDTLLVNGTFAPWFEVTAELTRLRLLNASAARSYYFGFSDGRLFSMIASDGGLLEAPIDLERIMLTPGERAEILVRMQPGEEVVLRSFPQDLGITQRLADRTGAADELDVLLLSAGNELRQAQLLPAIFGSLGTMTPADAAQTRTFELGDNRINGQRMDMERIDAEVAAETIEVWEVQNIHTKPHNFHIHDVQFLVLDIDGDAPPSELTGWKDTIYAPPGVLLRLIMRFGQNPDPEIPYMYHCHLLWHEDAGMMGQFVVQ
ncbi:multicopper oxidase family protein [Microbacterium sp. CCH5-D1]|uniref:multicopper oxidase family protein n=1 Tax=Microbacterium sp. CCH5-D1 TaxID=1768780 RepID=UPI0009E7BDF4|nr:multicopper oxidase domain-containing protein [Microbacterium sp. CCH5-D1]